jgi:signal transduction histidine kinase
MICKFISVFLTMFRLGLLATILLAVGFICVAQPNKISSLEKALEDTQSDSSRIGLLNELSFAYLTNNPRKSLDFANEALTLSRKINFINGEIVALNRLGENAYRRSNHANAISLTTQSLRLAEQQKDSVNIAYAYRLLGLTNTLGLKQYDLALQYQLKALEIFKKKFNPQRLASLYGNISWIYANAKINPIEGISMAYRGLHLADSLGDKQLVSYNMNSLGLLYLKQNKLDSALWYIEKSIKNGEDAGDNAVIVYNRIIKGNIFYEQKYFKRAIEEYEKANNEAKTLSMIGMVGDATAGLAKSYAAIGVFDKAYQNQLTSTRLIDSLQNWETTQKVLLIRLQFEQEKQQEKITQLEDENARSKKERFFFLGGGIIAIASLISVVVLVVINNRQRWQANVLLVEKNEEIASQNKQLKEANSIKNKLFSIVSHDLRSPLNSLKGMLAMVVRKEITVEEFNQFAPKLHQHVLGVGETLDKLLLWSRSQMEGWTNNRVAINLSEIIDKTFLLFNELANEKNISLSHEVDRLHTVLVDQNQIELILRNLVHNAIKFTTNNGSIKITSNQTSDYIDLLVADTGIGMS